MNDINEPGWRRLQAEGGATRTGRKFCSLDVEREVEKTIAALSKKELETFDMEEYHEFLSGGESTGGIDPGFEASLRRDLWWEMVAGRYGSGIPQA